MTNGATIDTIEEVLAGDAEIPERVSNRLILAAIRANHQTTAALTDRVECNEKEITQIKRRSDVVDVISTLAVAIGSAVGIWTTKQ